MTDIAPLGFAIDTGPLKSAQDEARKTASELGAMADAADRASRAAQQRAEVARRALEAERAAAKAANDETSAGVMAAEKAAQKAQALADAKRKEAAATKAAADEARAHADTHKGATAQVIDFTTRLEQFGRTAQTATGQISGLGGALGGSGIGSVASGISRIVSGLGPMGIALGATVAGVGALAKAYISLNLTLAEYQDRQDQIAARLRNTLGGSASQSSLMLNNITSLSQQTGMGFRPTADSFLRLARTREDIGATAGEVLTLTELTQKLGKVSGAGAGETASGMLQLSQALAAGRLNGDELRSIMENMPALAKAIADGLGVSVGQLRNMGAEGQLTSDKVFKALLSQATKIREEFAKLPETVEQATTRLGDSFDRLKGNLGKRLSSSETIRGGINATNSLVSGIADALAPETETDRLKAHAAELEKAIEAQERYVKLANDRAKRGASWLDGLGGQSRLNADARTTEENLFAMQRSLANVRAQQFRQSEIESMEALKDLQAKETASVSRATKQADETLSLAKSQKEAATTTKTLTEGIAVLEKQMEMGTAPDNAVAKLATLKSALIAVESEAKNATDALSKYIDETQKIGEARFRFGGTDSSFGMEVRKIIDDAAKASGGGRNVTETEAIAAVIARRLTEARTVAEKEADEIKRLEEQVRRAGTGRDALARLQAEHAKRLELGSIAAALPDGKELIKAAGEKAAREAALRRQIQDRESLLDPLPRSSGEVTRELRDVRQQTADLLSMRGMDEAQRSAKRFATDLAKELRQVPDGLKEAFMQAKQAQREAEQALATSDFVKGYKDRAELAGKELAISGLLGTQHEIAMGLLRAQNEAKQRGLVLDEKSVATIRESVAAQAQVNERLKEQAEATSKLDSVRSSSRSAIMSLIKGDTKGAWQNALSWGQGQAADNITQLLLGKGGEKGGGLFGSILGGLFGTGVGGQRGNSADNPLFVTFGGFGGAGAAGGLFGLLSGAGGSGNTASGAGGAFGAAGGALRALGSALGVSGNVNMGFDAKLKDILSTAALNFPNKVSLISGLRPGDSRFHGQGLAADAKIFGADGKALGNYQDASSFRTYEQFAQTARAVQMQKYPELADDFRWGGYFSGGRGKYGAMDTMHFDLGGRRAPMGGGSWEGGLTDSQRAMWPGAESFGMAAKNIDKLAESSASAATSVTDMGSNLAKTATSLTEGATGISGATGKLSLSMENTATQTEGMFGTLLGGLWRGIDGLVSGLGSLVSNLFSGAGGLFKGFGGLFGALFHDGGEVGVNGTPRFATSSLWTGAPRYHAGTMLGHDERPAILQTGERVFSRMDNGRLVQALEAMSMRTEAPQTVQQGNVTYQTIKNDFRGVDPSMRAFVTAQIAKSQRSTVDASVSEVRNRSQNIPGYLSA